MAMRRRRLLPLLGQIERGLKQSQARTAKKVRHGEAERKTKAVKAREVELSQILVARPRCLQARRRKVAKALDAGGPAAMGDRVARTLRSTGRPEGFPTGCAADYMPENRELRVRYALPSQKMVPTASAFRYVKARDEVVPTKRREYEVKNTYRQVLARTVLRAVAEALDVTPPDLVDVVVFDGYVTAPNPSTGRVEDVVLLTVDMTRASFEELVLDEPALDPIHCLRRRLHVTVPANPFDIEGTLPKIRHDLTKYKLIEGMDVVAGLDSRPDLLDMNGTEFEALVKDVFLAQGVRAWQTQSSRDDGFDVVAVSDDVVTGGVCVIEAKRYANRAVPIKEVRALYASMDDKKANKGFLVTTAWFGDDAQKWAARNRITLIDGRELVGLLQDRLNHHVLLGHARLPRHWQQRTPT